MVNPYQSPPTTRRPIPWSRVALYGVPAGLFAAYVVCRLVVAYEVPIQEAMETLSVTPVRWIHDFLAWVV